MNSKRRRIFCFLIIAGLCCSIGCRTGSDGNGKPAESNTKRAESKADSQENTEVIIDSRLSLAEAVGQPVISKEYKEEYNSRIKNLDLVDVRYYSFDEKLHQGQILIDKSLKNDIVEIFQLIKENRFPIAKVIPVSRYDFDDDRSMKDNNTSAFNFRLIKNSKKLSNHSFGRAIDINPFLNPQFIGNIAYPEGSNYEPSVSGTITQDSFIVKAFRDRGWKWGEEFKNKDYQHFEKVKP